jgi:hypothetical protein
VTFQKGCQKSVDENSVKNRLVPFSAALIQTVTSNGFTDKHAMFLMKYPHSVQDKLAEVSIRKKLTVNEDLRAKIKE